MDPGKKKYLVEVAVSSRKNLSLQTARKEKSPLGQKRKEKKQSLEGRT